MTNSYVCNNFAISIRYRHSQLVVWFCMFAHSCTYYLFCTQHCIVSHTNLCIQYVGCRHCTRELTLMSTILLRKSWSLSRPENTRVFAQAECSEGEDQGMQHKDKTKDRSFTNHCTYIRKPHSRWGSVFPWQPVCSYPPLLPPPSQWDSSSPLRAHGLQ